MTAAMKPCVNNPRQTWLLTFGPQLTHTTQTQSRLGKKKLVDFSPSSLPSVVRSSVKPQWLYWWLVEISTHINFVVLLANGQLTDLDLSRHDKRFFNIFFSPFVLEYMPTKYNIA